MAVKQRLGPAETSFRDKGLSHYSDYRRFHSRYLTTSKIKLQDNTLSAASTKRLADFSVPTIWNFANQEGFDLISSENSAVYFPSDPSLTNQYNIISRNEIYNPISLNESYHIDLWINNVEGEVNNFEIANKTTQLAIEDEISTVNSVIQKAQLLTKLAVGWDGEDAAVVDKKSLRYTCSLLRLYYNYIDSHFGIKIQLPEISPCRDGSIDLEWHTSNAQLLINIRADKDGTYSAYYYGDRHNNKMQVKGSTPIIEFSEHLAVWMKYLA